MKFLRNAAVVLKDFGVATFLLKFMYRGYLYDIGWIESRKKGSCIDRNGEPIPWLTYPFISFIKGRLNKKMDVFEYGSGNSTLFYANAVRKVVSVEDNSQWYKYVQSLIPDNVSLTLEANNSNRYVAAASSSNQNYDIIIVDGRHRVNCIKSSVHVLKDDGVLILDNSDRPKYQEGIDFMTSRGFKRIDFWGLAPSAPNYTCTTLFYRRDNILNV